MALADYSRVTLSQVARMPERAARKMYSDLRSVANKRIERLGKSEFSNTSIYREHSEGFKKLSEMSESDLMHALPELSNFVYGDTTVSSMREAAKAGAAELGQYEQFSDWVTPENYYNVIEMLDYYHDLKLDKLYDSERVLELAKNAKKFSDPEAIKRHYEFWLEHADELSDLETTKKGKSTGSAIQWRNALGISRYDD